MTPLPAFTISTDTNLYDVVGDLLAGELRQRSLSGAVVTFTNNLTESDFVIWEGELNRIRHTVTARVSSDGTILRQGLPVKLLANDPGLSVEGIQWEVSIQPRIGDAMTSWWFDAGEGGDTVDIGVTAHQTNPTPITGIPIPPTWSSLTGKPAVIGAGSTQAAARTAIGLGNVNDTADTAKPVSTAQAAADAKVLQRATAADVVIDFTTKANGAPPSVVDTGQTADYILQNVSNWQPKINSGKLLAAGANGTTLPSTGNYADYYQVQCDGDVRAAGTRFTVNSSDGSSTTGYICLAVWNVIYESAGTTVPKTPAHITVDCVTGQVAFYIGDGGGSGSSHLIATKVWSITPPAANGTAVWELAFYIDPVAGTIYIYLPGADTVTGSRYVTTTDAEIATFFTTYHPALPVPTLAQCLSGSNVVMVEHFAAATPSTARYPQILDMWGDKVLPSRDRERALRENGTAPAAALAYIAAATSTFTNKTLTGPKVDNVKDTNGATAINISATASAVNYMQLVSGATGVPTSVRAAGTDTNVTLNLRGKGTGGVTVGSSNVPVVTTTDTQTVTNKTIDLASNTLTSTIAQLNTAVTNADVAQQIKEGVGRITGSGTRQWGVPGAGFSSQSTFALTTNTASYHVFDVRYPITITAHQFEVTTAPGSNANVAVGIYLADTDIQPTGAPFYDSGSIAVASGFTGRKTTTGLSVALNPGRYLVVMNTDTAMTVRALLSPAVVVFDSMGAAAFLGRLTGTQTYGAFPTPGTGWTTGNVTAGGAYHFAVLQWTG